MTSKTIPVSKGWKKTTLGDIATYVNGRAFKPAEWSKSGTPIIRIQNLNNPKAEYNYYDGDIEQKYHIKNGDLLFAWSASLGAYIWKGGNAFLNQHIFKVLPRDNIDKTFIYYLLDKITNELYTKAHGSGMVHVTKGKFEATSVNIPPLATQQAIVNKIETLFAEIDAGIGHLKTAEQQLKQYRQALLKNAFNGELTKQWRAEHVESLPSAAELLEQIQTAREQHHAQQLADWQSAVKIWEENGKQGKKPSKPKTPTQAVQFEEDFADLPNGWIWGKLSDLGELARGKSKHRPRNDKKLFGGKYPFIQTGEVRAANRVIKEYEQTYSEFGLEQSKLWKKGTLCITIAANIAETAFLGFDACFPDSIVGFSALKAVSPEYIELFIKSARTKIEAYAPATAQKNINLNTLENLIVPYCSLAEQTQIVAILESKLTACDQLANEITAQLKQAELLKQAVLKAAFSGSLLEQPQ
ncbi:restriction endonuclease subunit S [Avibacterium avium]|uniref:restriction endonuclease subunit S n=1 Tax=Avibacterium avium TaxID=751 RepID=UPI003BF79FEA